MQLLHMEIFHPMFHLNLILTFKAMKKHHKSFCRVWEQHKDDYSEEKNLDIDLKKSKHKIIYLGK